MNKSSVSTYPEELESKIGFNKIRNFLKESCVSELGKEFVGRLFPTSSKSQIIRDLDIVSELKRLLTNHDASLTEHGFYDLREDFKVLRAEGNWWEPEQFIDLRSLLRHSFDLIRLLSKEETLYLSELYKDIQFPENLLKKLEQIFNDKGEVNSNASPELLRLRNALEQNRQQVRKSIDHIFRSAKKDGLVPEGSSISVRDGRLVIPIMAEGKRQIRGFVHDESATGQTVFIEPAAVLEGNNRQRELEYQERREVIKILKSISYDVYLHRQVLGALTEFMAEVDFLRSKLKLSDKLKAVRPEISDSPEIKLLAARHPILLITGHEVVPLDVEINDAQRIILISGPNAGGKSVALKTVALLQYMVQCGLPIPSAEGTTMGIYTGIFIDIGDEQSIENDLSTYSSHLRNMKNMLDHADEHTLILIDEFGSGTEPQFGGALAEAMLTSFMKKDVKGVITTHYGNLKTFAEKNYGIVNAAMLFDVEHLKPLYKLSVGKAGSSHALEIAHKTGLPMNVIDQAKKLLGKEAVDYEKALAKLETKIKYLEDQELILNKREKEADRNLHEYQKLKDYIESNRKKLLDEAKKEASSIVAKANREIEKTIRHIKENRAERKETKRIRKQLEDFKSQNNPLKTEELSQPIDEPIQNGDYVEIRDNGMVGQVTEIADDSAEVLIGNLKTIVKLKRLRRSARKVLRQQSQGRRSGLDFPSKVADFSRQLDIRGKRVEEAIIIVEKYLDDALLAGAVEVRILHGKGNGVLKDLVRNHLKKFPQVDRVADEHVERGGAGISVVTLK